MAHRPSSFVAAAAPAGTKDMMTSPTRAATVRPVGAQRPHVFAGQNGPEALTTGAIQSSSASPSLDPRERPDIDLSFEPSQPGRKRRSRRWWLSPDRYKWGIGYLYDRGAAQERAHASVVRTRDTVAWHGGGHRGPAWRRLLHAGRPVPLIGPLGQRASPLDIATLN
jgi:hypothetical protein